MDQAAAIQCVHLRAIYFIKILYHECVCDGIKSSPYSKGLTMQYLSLPRHKLPCGTCFDYGVIQWFKKLVLLPRPTSLDLQQFAFPANRFRREREDVSLLPSTQPSNTLIITKTSMRVLFAVCISVFTTITHRNAANHKSLQMDSCILGISDWSVRVCLKTFCNVYIKLKDAHRSKSRPTQQEHQRRYQHTTKIRLYFNKRYKHACMLWDCIV